jgi:hypothetical protein
MLDAGKNILASNIPHLVVPHNQDEEERKRTRNTRNQAKQANSCAGAFACFVSFRVFRVLLSFPIESIVDYWHLFPIFD